MLQHLLEMIVLRARNIGLASQMLEYAAQFETRPRTTSPIYEPVLQQIFELMPHPCIVVISECVWAVSCVVVDSLLGDQWFTCNIGMRHTKPPRLLPLADEVQRLVLPQVPGTGNIDVTAQKQARRLLRVSNWVAAAGRDSRWAPKTD